MDLWKTMSSITATVVTIVDKTLNSTKVTTSLPPGWTPPPTNAAGTQAHVITYDHSTFTLFVATVPLTVYDCLLTNVYRAFPTVIVRWPTEYTYCTEGDRCLSTYSNSITTKTISPPPQPTKAVNLDAGGPYNEVDPEQLSDPKGLLAMPVRGGAFGGWQPAYSALLGSVYPAFKCHGRSAMGGPDWGGLDSTWMNIVTSTFYTDAEETALSG